MKATDLMIGDWVYAKVQVDDTGAEPVFEKTPKRVTDLTKGINGIYVEGTSTFAGAEIEPIPLTPEILEENGFPYNNEERLYYPFSNKAFAIERDEHDDQVFYYSMYVYNPYRSFNWHEIIEIRYVHELQHALRLSGIDKEIVL